MKTSATRKIFTFRRKACAISGNDSLKMSPSKKACLTSGQPAALTTTRTIAPKKTTVLSVATTTARRLLPPGDAVPRMRALLEPVSAS
jgi:hypothetical protein